MQQSEPLHLPRFNSRLDVLTYLRENRGRLSGAERDALIGVHDCLPSEEESARQARRRREMEHDLLEAWRVVCAATEHAGERQRRMAARVAAIMDGDGVWAARQISLLYLEAGMRAVNRLVIDIALSPGYERWSPVERLRTLDRAVGAFVGREVVISYGDAIVGKRGQDPEGG